MSTHNTPANPVGDKEQQARDILSGQAASPRKIYELAKDLVNENKFGLARKLLARARKTQDSDWSQEERLELAQKHALATYKDPDLPADQKFTRALAILREGDDLKTTHNQETLGLAGAIYKRRWEGEGDRRDLERSLAFYVRHWEEGLPANAAEKPDPQKRPGWTAINAAFVLDLLAGLEEEDAKENQLPPISAQARREMATEIRRRIIDRLSASTGQQYEQLIAQLGAQSVSDEKAWRDECINCWWLAVTVAQAHFGLGQYGEAQQWMERALNLPGVPAWQYQATVQQLVALAQLRARGHDTPAEAEHAREVLEKCLQAQGIENYKAAVASAYVGKVGLALSGGGFRASLFHIGVLAKLADIGVLNHIEVISCVSGGSIIGAHYYLELRRLFRQKASDAELGREDYLHLVDRIVRDFLAGVQANIRTRVLGGLIPNFKMIFSDNYSRTMRVGELYEKHIYSRIDDDEGHKPRWLNELRVKPNDEVEGKFAPKRDNWRRTNKVPILILNATSLNTGHVWQFTASFMGEPPAAINTEIDAGYRLRRMYYGQAPQIHQQMRLGYAVAASSCVPGLFEPLPLAGLYPNKTVRLVDGGVFDNQGTASLLEQECKVLLVSDASGQMGADDNPSNSFFNVVLRSSGISQERVRWAQHRELEARRRAGLLKGLLFIHLKKDLDTDPADWVDCPDPYDSTDDARPPELRGPLTRYGVRKDIQQLLSGVRTDLDSFSEAEAYALMASGYLMAEYEFARSLQDKFPGVTEEQIKWRNPAWPFLRLRESIAQPGRDEKLKKLLKVASEASFKIWRLAPQLRLLRNLVKVGSAVALAAALLWVLRHPALIQNTWEIQLFSLTLGEGWRTFTLRLGWVSAFLAGMIVAHIFGSLVMKVVSWKETLLRVATGLLLGTLGFLVTRLHLLTFDRWYLRYGKSFRLLEREAENKKS